MADISKEQLRKEVQGVVKDGTTATKDVIKKLEDKLGEDLADRKKEIEKMIQECQEDGSEEEEGSEEEGSEEEEETKKKPAKRPAAAAPPAKKNNAKKSKGGSSSEEESEGEEGSESDDNYAPKKPTPKKKAPKRKGKGSDSDSDSDWGKAKKSSGGGGGGGGAGGRGKGGGYTRALKLSPQLATLMGKESMARHEVVKKMWALIKERNLYDPNNKQFAICDEELFKVMGVKRFRTFGMMKYLKTHFRD